MMRLSLPTASVPPMAENPVSAHLLLPQSKVPPDIHSFFALQWPAEAQTLPLPVLDEVRMERVFFRDKNLVPVAPVNDSVPFPGYKRVAAGKVDGVRLQGKH